VIDFTLLYTFICVCQTYCGTFAIAVYFVIFKFSKAASKLQFPHFEASLLNVC